MTKILQLGLGSGKSKIDKLFNILNKRTVKINKLEDKPPIGKYSYNAGDKVVIETIRHMIRDMVADCSITYMNSRKEFTNVDIDFINQHDAMIIGGGGFFMYDTFKNHISDWQWGVTEELIDQVKVPIIVCSPGYNRFRGQREFTKEFNRTVSKLIEKSSFFSMRHSGDIRCLKNYIHKPLHNKIKLQFCPTIMYNHLIFKEKANLNSGNVGFTLAGDRLGHRHRDIARFVQEMNQFKNYLESSGHKVFLILHHGHDNWIQRYIDFENIIDLKKLTSEDIFKEYANMEYVVSDRGHGQMLSFSVGCKIITPVSHDKLKYFLEDINMSDLGVEADANDLSSKLIDIFELLQNTEAYQERWKVAMDLIKSNYEETFNDICKVLNI